MKAKPVIALLALMMLANLGKAQDELPVLSADRPGSTTNVEVLPLHKVSWENGFGFESAPDGSCTFSLNNTILRYGIFKNMEVFIRTDFKLYNDGLSDEYSFGVAPLIFGTKLRVYESTNWLPSIGLLAELKSPHIGSKELRPSHLAPAMHLLFEHSITNWLHLHYNAGLEWDGETATPRTFLALCLGFNITDNFGTFIETYNYLHPEESHCMTEFGFTWMPSRRVQLDIECSLDFLQLGKYYAIGSGIAWMIN